MSISYAVISDTIYPYAFLYKKTDFYKFRSLLHFVKMLVGDNPQTPEILNFVEGLRVHRTLKTHTKESDLSWVFCDF